MGRRRKRKLDEELLELVRVEIAAMRTDVQAALTENAGVLSVRVRDEVEQRMSEPSALVHGLQGVRETIATRDADLANVLRRVGETCDALTGRVQIDRMERTFLVDAVNRLTTALAATGTLLPPQAPPTPRAAVIGGTVDPTPPLPAEVIDAVTDLIEAGSPDEIDLVAAARPSAGPAPTDRPVRSDGVEVRCRFGDRWVTGFEVCEVIRTDDRTRYRLRRCSDGSVIPSLFDEKDLRFFRSAFVERP